MNGIVPKVKWHPTRMNDVNQKICIPEPSIRKRCYWRGQQVFGFSSKPKSIPRSKVQRRWKAVRWAQWWRYSKTKYMQRVPSCPYFVWAFFSWNAMCKKEQMRKKWSDSKLLRSSNIHSTCSWFCCKWDQRNQTKLKNHITLTVFSYDSYHKILKINTTTKAIARLQVHTPII